MITELHPQADECYIHLIRHGATPHNLLEPPRMQGHRIDQSLAPQGREQAQALARAMASTKLAAVYTSPLRRAAETAAAIAEAQGLPTQVDETLLEANVGRWEDRGWPDIQANDAAAYAAFRADPVGHGYPGGENLAEVLQRTLIGIRSIAQRHRGQQVAVVSHSVVNRTLLGEVLGVPGVARHHLPQSNCGWSIIRWSSERPLVLSVNGVQHLRP